MNYTNLSHIKRSQKESLILRELSKMLHQLSLDDVELSGLFVNRIELSKKKGTCILYFYDPNGIESYRSKIGRLILYKPSLRKGIASALDSKYTPELRFEFDEQYEKQLKIENLLEKVKKDLDKIPE